MEIEEMRKDGYDMPFSCALSATTAVVGPIFPPSIQMVIFAMLTGASVGKLFMGGVIPAIVICLGFAGYVVYVSHKRLYPRGKAYTAKEFLSFTWKALPALLTPVILLGGIYTGIVTATESGVAAALYAILISAFAYKVMGWKELYKALSDTVKQAGMVMACLAAAFALNYVVVQSGIGVWVKELCPVHHDQQVGLHADRQHRSAAVRYVLPHRDRYLRLYPDLCSHCRCAQH